MKIMLIDDHPLFIEGIRGVLQSLDQSEILIQSCGSCEEALEQAETDDNVDLVLLDLNLPGMSGLEGLKQLRHKLPASPIVMLSASEDRTKVMQAIELGAKGFIPKSSTPEVIISAVQLVLSGGVYLPMAVLETVNSSQAKTSNNDGQTLTPRQVEVLKLLAEGHSNKTIGNQLSMAENTVRVHVSAILRFLDVANRTEAGVAAARMGLLAEGEF
ncbi:MAG: response regulator transcription factor [Gammaproteobacteria bacterium]|nr:response regulator transcription factor [Gammaproteobacteria bacterium]MDH5777252.1 response regulator transcription factor [Gammaproteobacteria bacterium]